MRYISKIDDIKVKNKTAVTLGKFDGIHLGHQKLIHKVTDKCKEGFCSVLITFDKPLLAFLRDADAGLLLTKEERRYQFSKYKLDYVIECQFTEEFAHMEAEAFIEEVLVKRLNVGYIAVGTDFTFGYKASGNYQLLQEFARIYGFEVEVVEKLTYQNSEISSTRIRSSIEEGKMEDAMQMLGFPYPVIGEVIHGKKLGRTLGIPTINLIPPKEKLLPPNGVYGSKIIIDGKIYQGTTNIGYKPTVSNDKLRGVETFIFDLNKDLYGKMIEVDLYMYKRPEQKFESVEQLKMQMTKDIEYVKKYFNDSLL